jgi:hypothetical protein
MKSFWIEITTGMIILNEDEIWPDGDAPENPSAMHVKRTIEEAGPLSKVLHDWNLDYDMDLQVGEV